MIALRRFGRLVGFGIGQLLAGRRLLVVLLLVLVPLLVPALLIAASGTASAEVALGLIRNLVLAVLLPVLCLVFATGAVGNEVRDGTMVNLVLKPLPRWVVLAAKYLAAVLATWAVLLPAEAVAILVVARGQASGRLLGGVALASALGALAYIAVGALLSLVTSRALLIGIAYVLLWEGAVAGVAPSAAALSIRGYTEGALAGLLGGDPLAFSSRLGPATAWVTGLLVALAAILLATRRLARMDLR